MLKIGTVCNSSAGNCLGCSDGWFVVITPGIFPDPDTGECIACN